MNILQFFFGGKKLLFDSRQPPRNAVLKSPRRRVANGALLIWTIAANLICNDCTSVCEFQKSGGCMRVLAVLILHLVA